MSDDDYTPATRPPGAPGGDRIRFESEGGVEQSIFGGSAADIERSILESTERNIQLLGRTITSVSDVKGNLGQGSLQEIQLSFTDGTIAIFSGIGISVRFA